MYKKIDKVLTKITTGVCFVSFIGIGFIMMLIVVNALMRKLLGFGINGSYEIVERTLMCVVFASFAYTQSHNGHIQISMILLKLPRTIAFIMYGLSNFVGAAVALILSYAAFQQFNVSKLTGTVTTVVGIPLYPFFLVEAICMLVFFVTLLWSMVKSFMAIKNDELCDEIKGTWS